MPQNLRYQQIKHDDIDKNQGMTKDEKQKKKTPFSGMMNGEKKKNYEKHEIQMFS